MNPWGCITLGAGLYLHALYSYADTMQEHNYCTMLTCAWKAS